MCEDITESVGINELKIIMVLSHIKLGQKLEDDDDDDGACL